MIKDIIWNIKAFIAQPIIPTKKFSWVIKNDCSWIGWSNNDKWVYYWYGDDKKGYQVKVRGEVVKAYNSGFDKGYQRGFDTGYERRTFEED